MGWDRLIDLEAKVTQLAMREACKYIDEKLSVKVEKLGKDSLVNCAKTSMSSKLIATDSGFFANLVVDAVKAVKTTTARGEIKYPIKGINILKAHVKSAKDSYLLKGYTLNTGRAARGMPTRVAPARIACLDFNLQKTKMQMGVRVLISDPRELEKIRQSMGLYLSNGTVRNNLEAGVIEPAMSKVKIIQFATEAAIAILRINDMIICLSKMSVRARRTKSSKAVCHKTGFQFCLCNALFCL